MSGLRGFAVWLIGSLTVAFVIVTTVAMWEAFGWKAGAGATGCALAGAFYAGLIHWIGANQYGGPT